jgi:hypothetical protein
MESDPVFAAGQERVVFSPSRSERNDPANPSMFRMVLPSLGQNGDVYYTINWCERDRRLFPHSCDPNDDWVIGTIVILPEQRVLPELPNSILWRAKLVPYGQLPAAMAPPMEEEWLDIDDDEWDRAQAAAREQDRREQAEQDAHEARVNAAELAAMERGLNEDRLQRGHQAAQPVQGYDWQAHIGAQDPEHIALDNLWANIVANRAQIRPPRGYQARGMEEDNRMDQDGGGSRTRSKKSKKRRPTRRRRDRRSSSKRNGRNGRKSRKTRATRRR